MNEIAIASVIGAGIFGGALALGLYFSAEGDGDAFVAAPQRPAILSKRSASEGAPSYDFYCASCHGRAGEGGFRGPPLVHPLYDIGERTDSMFMAAIRNGAPQKNWEFGPMPAIRNISARRVAAVVGFVAELQAHNAR